MPVPFSGSTAPPPEIYYLGSPIIKDSVPLKLPGYDPAKDVERIYEATHGPGTNNSKLIQAFVGKVGLESYFNTPLTWIIDYKGNTSLAGCLSN
jgi:hypothetical protein